MKPSQRMKYKRITDEPYLLEDASRSGGDQLELTDTQDRSTLLDSVYNPGVAELLVSEYRKEFKKKSTDLLSILMQMKMKLHDECHIHGDIRPVSKELERIDDRAREQFKILRRSL